MRWLMPVPNAFSTASFAAKRAAMCSYCRRLRRQYSSSRSVNSVSCRCSSSSTSRRSRSTPTASMPTRTFSSARRSVATGLDHVDQVLDREERDDLLGLQGALELTGVDLRHDLVELLGSLGRDDLVRIRELVVRDAALDVVAEIRGLDLHAGALLDAEQDVEQVDRLGSEVVHQRGFGRHLVVVQRESLDHGLLYGTVHIGHAMYLLLLGNSLRSDTNPAPVGRSKGLPNSDLGGYPAVHGEQRARDVTGAGARQEDGRLSDLLHRGEALLRDLLGDPLAAVLLHQAGDHVGRREAREHGVDADPEARELDSAAAGEGVDGALGCGVVGLVGPAPLAHHR